MEPRLYRHHREWTIILPRSRSWLWRLKLKAYNKSGIALGCSHRVWRVHVSLTLIFWYVCVKISADIVVFNQSINQSIIFRVALVAMPLLGHYGCYSQEMSHDNVWEWLLEQCVFQLLPESRQRIGWRDVDVSKWVKLITFGLLIF